MSYSIEYLYNLIHVNSHKNKNCMPYILKKRKKVYQVLLFRAKAVNCHPTQK